MPQPAGHRRDARCATGASCGTTRKRVRGTAENPMTRAEVDAKSYDLLAPVLGAARARRLCDAVWSLDEARGRARLAAVAARLTAPVRLTGEAMNRIVHLALKVDDLERTTEFYREGVRLQGSQDREGARPHVAPSDRRRDRRHADQVRRGHAVGGVEGRGRGTLHPPFRAWKSMTSRQATQADQALRLRDHQRSRRDPGQVPRARRHGLRNRAQGPLQEAGAKSRQNR